MEAEHLPPELSPLAEVNEYAAPADAAASVGMPTPVTQAEGEVEVVGKKPIEDVSSCCDPLSSDESETDDEDYGCARRSPSNGVLSHPIARHRNRQHLPSIAALRSRVRP